MKPKFICQLPDDFFGDMLILKLLKINKES